MWLCMALFHAMRYCVERDEGYELTILSRSSGADAADIDAARSFGASVVRQSGHAGVTVIR